MNDRQAEELLALEAIYPDLVSWTELPAAEGVEVKITAPVTFEHAREVEVVDWPASATPLGSGIDETSRVEAAASISFESGRGAAASAILRPRRARSRCGGKEKAKQAGPKQVAAPLVATAKVFQPRSIGVKAPSSAPPTDSRQAVPLDFGGGGQVAPSAAHSAPQDRPRVRIIPRQDAPSTPTSMTGQPMQSSQRREQDNARSGTGGSTSTLQPRRLSLRHLPAIHVSLRLPLGYPESAPPECITISTDGDWLGLDRRRAAERKLADLYTGDECLLYLLDSVSSNSPEFDATFSLDSPLVLRQASPAVGVSTDPVPLSSYLTEHDRRASSTQFATSSHACPLCFATQRGSACIRLGSCGCVFCVACLRDYFSLLVTEGLVRSVACPSRGCVEARAQWEKDGATSRTVSDRDDSMPGRVAPSEIEELVGEEGRKRWEWLREKARVESDPSITWCPREACQAPVPRLSEDEEKLRVCPACEYSFCVFCRRGWHGTRNACALPQSSAIVSGYLSGDAEQRRTLEVRYGTANIKRLVAAYEEERALQEWLQAHSTQCPGCSAWVEKSQGCNHMTCAKCATHFCYRCGKSISPRDPYKHFATPGMTCYGKLFDFAPGQEPEPEQWVNFLGEDAY
ncbi:hypothetical protein JCM3774_002065 [Rhodotorula dairenensis]